MRLRADGATFCAWFHWPSFVAVLVLLALSPMRAPAAGISGCIGDCDGGGEVTIDEIISMVNLALSEGHPSSCANGDANQDHMISIDEIIAAVGNALSGCSAATPTATATGNGSTSTPLPTSTCFFTPTPGPTPPPGTSDPDAIRFFRAPRISGDQETPPIVSSATGTAMLTLSADEQSGVFELTVDDLDLDQVVAAHFHAGAQGVAGPIVYTLFHLVNGEPFQNPWRTTIRPDDLEPNTCIGINTFADLIAKIRAGEIYVNVHTVRNGGGGEIRGQLLPQSGT